MRLVLFLLFQLYRRRNLGTERLNNLAKDTQLISGRAWTQTQVHLAPKPTAACSLQSNVCVCVCGGDINKEIINT